MLKVGLIGCGRISVRHAQLLGEGHIEGAELAAVCDLIEERAVDLSKKYDVPAYTDPNDMMTMSDIDLVVILTPSGVHAANVIDMAKYGRDIVVEKPMALRLTDADAMIDACDRNGCRLFVVKQNRFNVPVQKLREAIKNDRFGKLILGTVRVRWCRPQAYYDQDAWRGTWAQDGGVLTNQASHHIDLLEWMMGEVESVFARSTTALADIETEDTAVVTLKFRNGALGVIEATTATRPKDLEGSLSILGEHGSVEIAGFAVNEMRHWNFVNSNDDDATVLSEYSVNPPNVYGFGHKEYYDHVVASINSKSPALVDGLEGRKSLELITAIYESVETSSEVKLRFTPRLSKLGLA